MKGSVCNSLFDKTRVARNLLSWLGSKYNLLSQWTRLSIQLPVFAVLGKTVGFIRGIIFLKKLEKEKEVVQATQMRNGKYWMLVVVCQLEIE